MTRRGFIPTPDDGEPFDPDDPGNACDCCGCNDDDAPVSHTIEIHGLSQTFDGPYPARFENGQWIIDSAKFPRLAV